MHLQRLVLWSWDVANETYLCCFGVAPVCSCVVPDSRGPSRLVRAGMSGGCCVACCETVVPCVVDIKKYRKTPSPCKEEIVFFSSMRDVKRHKVKPRTATDGRRVDAFVAVVGKLKFVCVVPPLSVTMRLFPRTGYSGSGKSTPVVFPCITRSSIALSCSHAPSLRPSFSMRKTTSHLFLL